jgi:hypothetical protein
MQEHHYEFEVDATPEQVWEVFWYHGPDKPMTPGVTIEILHPGDATGEGLVRHCHFPVPRWLGTGGIGRSWEWVTQVRPYTSWKYDAIGKPLWSKALGWQRYDDLGDDTTRVTFHEEYHVFNPLVRVLLERRVHRFISKDNDRLVQASIEGALRAYRARR